MLRPVGTTPLWRVARGRAMRALKRGGARGAATHGTEHSGSVVNLHRMLAQRAAAGGPVRVGLIGAGKFGSMFLAQVPHSPVEVIAIADLDAERARGSCRRRLAEEQIDAPDFDAARATGRTYLTDDGQRADRRAGPRRGGRGDRHPGAGVEPCPRRFEPGSTWWR